jgi:hypothetical protein
MIRYALVCEAGHSFESWFRSSADFDAQSRRGLVDCPHCGSTRIAKQIMAPAIRSAPETEAVLQPVVKPDPRQAELQQMMRKFRAFVEQNAENVGSGFAEEARKIHYGETGERAIYGQATPNEIRSLHEEGVEVAPLPILPDDHH